MEWISDSEFVIGNKIYHCVNPEWIKRLQKIREGEYEWEFGSVYPIRFPVSQGDEHDNDTTKDQEASRTQEGPSRV